MGWSKLLSGHFQCVLEREHTGFPSLSVWYYKHSDSLYSKAKCVVGENHDCHNQEFDENMQEKMSRGAPMKRLGEPKEIVAMMLMMLSPANTYMSGQCIAIDGGVSAQ